MLTPRGAAWAALGLTLGTASAASAQSVRVTGATTIHYLDARPLTEDSVPASATSGSGLLRRSADGHLVRCITGDPFCRYRRAAAARAAVPVVQDIAVTGWGVGRGIHFYARLQGRGMLVGDEPLWPRGDDPLDLLAAYVEFERPTFRGRAGRQWKTSGLGYSTFDGASLLFRPTPKLTVEAYGGRGLLRGAYEPLTSEELLRQESLAPEVGSYVIGGQVSARPHPAVSASAVYQREIRTDRAGLYSERAAVDAGVRLGDASVEGSLKVDWATGALNDGRLRVWLFPVDAVALNIYARHYRPSFDLWTIWEAFSPVGFGEVGVGASWRRWNGPLAVELWGARRRYASTDASATFGDVRSDGWRVGAAAAANLGAAWRLEALYRADIGFGAAGSDGTATLRREFEDGRFAALSVAAFQRLYELRTDEGTTVALGADGGLRLDARTRVVAGLTLYRHGGPQEALAREWTQLRGWLRVEWAIGPEPGGRFGSGGGR